ncbi:MAG: dihydroorotase [Devosia sp.]
MYERLITGRVVTPNGILEQGWIAVTGGGIAGVGSGARPEAGEVIDYGQAHLLPGAVDGQTHAGSQIGFPGMAPTTKAAVIGGVTTIVDMPYDEPDPIWNGRLLADKIAAVNDLAVCDVALYGTVPNEPVESDVRALVAGGVCAFKISSFEAHPHRFPRIGSGATRALIEMLDGTGLPLGLHNEDQEIVRKLAAEFKAAGRTKPEDHSPSRPEVAELSATATFLALGAGATTPLHIVHISTPDGFDMTRRFRESGQPATAEMCVHYLHFDADTDMPRLGGPLKVNPPIRGGRREALWDVLERGDCTFVSSDHSAWPIERKTNPSIFDVAAGMPGLEALLPVFFTDAAARYGQDKAALMSAEWLAQRPAQFFGLSRKGQLSPGFDADIAVLQPEPYAYDAKANPDGPGWSAYDGETFTATPVATWVRGELAYDGSAVVAAAGSGRFVPRG